MPKNLVKLEAGIARAIKWFVVNDQLTYLSYEAKMLRGNRQMEIYKQLLSMLTKLDENSKKKFISEFETKHKSLSTVEKLCLLRKTVEINDPKLSAFIIISGVKLKEKNTSILTFETVDKSYKEETRKHLFNLLQSSLEQKSRDVFILNFINMVKINPDFLGSENCLKLLKKTVEINDPELSALIIISGVNLKEKTTSGWMFETVDNSYKEKTEDELRLLRYRQLISRRHEDKIISSLIIKNSEGIAPLSYIATDEATTSEDDPNQVNAQVALKTLAEKLRELRQCSNYKYIWPIFKIIGLAVQGIHNSALLRTDKGKNFLDERLLIYIDENNNIDDFLIANIGTNLSERLLGHQNYLLKEILLCGKVSANELMSTFLHESVHFVLSDIYNHYSSLPYAISEADQKKFNAFLKSNSSPPQCFQDFDSKVIEKFKKLLNLPKSMSSFKSIYCKDNSAISKMKSHCEFFSYFVEAIFNEEIKISEIEKNKNDPFYNFYMLYKEYVFNPAVKHYRFLINKAMERKQTMTNRNTLRNLANVKLNTLLFFDDTDSAEYSDYEPDNKSNNGLNRYSMWCKGGTVAVVGIVGLAALAAIVKPKETVEAVKNICSIQ